MISIHLSLASSAGSMLVHIISYEMNIEISDELIKPWSILLFHYDIFSVVLQKSLSSLMGFCGIHIKIILLKCSR